MHDVGNSNIGGLLQSVQKLSGNFTVYGSGYLESYKIQG